MKETLEQYPVRVEIQVQWGEMDAANHVNNLNYLRWCETARIRYFEEMGMDMRFKEGAPILGWQDCKYIFPMTYPDTAIIGVRTYEVQEDRMMMETAIFSKRHQRIAAIARQRVIPYDYKTLQKMPFPVAWRTAIERLEGKK